MRNWKFIVDPNHSWRASLVRCAPLLLFLFALIALGWIQSENRFLTSGAAVRGVPFADAIAWEKLAEDLAVGRGMSGAWGGQRPIYPMLLAEFYTWTGPNPLIPKLLNLLLLSGTVVSAFFIVRYFAPPGIAAICAVALLLDPELQRLTVQSLSEVAGIFLFALTIVLFLQGLKSGSLKWYGLAGAALALCNLTRTLTIFTAFPYAILLLIAEWRRRRAPGPPARALFCFLASCALVLLPWLLRMHAAYGIWTISDTSARSLYAATSQEFKTYSQDIELELRKKGVSPDIKSQYEFFMREAKANFASHPEVLFANAAESWSFFCRSLEHSANFALPLAPPLILFIFLAFGNFESRGRTLKSILIALCLLFVTIRVPQFLTGLTVCGALLGALIPRFRLSLVLTLSLLFTGAALSLVNEATNPRYLTMTNWLFAILFCCSLFFIFDVLAGTRSAFSKESVCGYVGLRIFKSCCACSLLFFCISSARLFLLHVSPPPPAHIGATALDAAEQQHLLEEARARYPEVFPKPIAEAPFPLAEKLPNDHEAESNGRWMALRGHLSRFSYFFPAHSEDRHWSRLFRTREYPRTVFLLEPWYGIVSGELPEQIADEEVLVIGCLSIDTRYAYYDSRYIIETLLIVPWGTGDAAPNWSRAYLGGDALHQARIAALNSLAAVGG